MSKATTRSSLRRSKRQTSRRDFSVGDVVEVRKPADGRFGLRRSFRPFESTVHADRSLHALLLSEHQISTAPWGRTVQLLHKIQNGKWLVAHDEKNSPDEEMSEEDFVRVVIASPGGTAGTTDGLSIDVVAVTVSKSRDECAGSVDGKGSIEHINGTSGTVEGRSGNSRSSRTASERKGSTSHWKTARKQNATYESNQQPYCLHRGHPTDSTTKADEDPTVQVNNRRRSTRSKTMAFSAVIQSETSTTTESTATSATTAASPANDTKDKNENDSTTEPLPRSTRQRNKQGKFLKQTPPSKRSNTKVKTKPKSKVKAKAKTKTKTKKLGIKNKNKTNHGVKRSPLPNETVIRVPMNTGTLVLYRGLYPRAEFIRRR